MKSWAVPEKLPILQWATKYRYFNEAASAIPGRYSTLYTPWVPYIMDALMDNDVREVWVLKGAGVSFTEGILNNWLGWVIDVDPSGVMGMFPKDAGATKFIDEKFVPMVKSTKRLHKKIDVFTQRKGSRQHYKKFAGGYLSLVSANSIDNVQSTHLKRAFMEEPDRCARDSSGQGSPLANLRDRIKSYLDSKLVAGGSPGIKGLSVTKDNFLLGDQQYFPVPCHDCGEYHVLTWDNVTWEDDFESVPDEIFGTAKPETARYVCPHCGSMWSNVQKNLNVRKLTCVRTKPKGRIASFFIPSLYSPFPGDALNILVEKYLNAVKQREKGDESEMIAFETTVLAIDYEYKSDVPDEDKLAELELDYKPLNAPNGVLKITAGVDFQSSGRIAIQVIGAGRGEEIWVLYFDEIYGNITDKTDPIWNELEKFLTQPIRHQSGKFLHISAASFDTSDGNTADNVYDFIRTFNRRHSSIDAMAVKGSSTDYGSKEIFSKPKTPLDTRGKQNTKSQKYGLRVFMVGTHKAKDLIYSRLKLTGFGAGRLHFYKHMRSDYFKQLTSEVKVPHKTARGKEEYKKKSGVNNEALDTLGYAIHALRSTGFHLYTEAKYQRLETELMQASIFEIQNNDSVAMIELPPPPVSKTAPRVISMRNNT